MQLTGYQLLHELLYPTGANQSNVPIEMIEANLPLRIRRYGLAADTGGAGRFRGGSSLIREYELLAESAVFSLRSDKRAHPPHALAGGEPGQGPINLLRQGALETTLPVLVTKGIALKRSDIFHHVTQYGGGYGDPFTRDPAMVLDDVLEEKLSLGRALAAYGVMIRDGRVDATATALLRAQRPVAAPV